LKEGELTMIALTVPAEELQGIITKPTPDYSLEQIDQIVARCVAESAK
jgi:hypothetical protein